jgi:hypothetical protein
MMEMLLSSTKRHKGNQFHLVTQNISFNFISSAARVKLFIFKLVLISPSWMSREPKSLPLLPPSLSESNSVKQTGQ